jgi:hypothetical protein
MAISATLQKETPRAIISDDFTNKRPRSRRRAKATEKGPRTYRLASKPLTKSAAEFETLQLGLTIWKLQHRQMELIAKRVEADTQFREGDLLRLSIESPRVGYLYVIDRDWFTDGSSGETNLIFPALGEDNRMEAGKLIDIPAVDQLPFKTTPKPNQAGELLTIIVTSAPLPLTLSKDALPISSRQLAEWDELWGGLTERLEMDGGAGKTRTIEEQQAASRTRVRQLTRDDPGPQTIIRLLPKRADGLLFNLMLSYVR